MRTLHFTLGPVQGFVASARRTRDLYAGSFLLSYLAGQAMYAVTCAGGEIIFPAVSDKNKQITDPLLKAIRVTAEKKMTLKYGPETGSLPNRFKARIPDGFDPDSCRRAVLVAWQHIAAVVWEKFVNAVAGEGKAVREIWDRQVNGFWEINWAVGEEDNLLDRRKNWRSYVPAAEPGDKCTVMGNLQELSGYTRAQRKEREKQRAFWEQMGQKLPGLELRDDERLCAIALIKRLYPLVAEETIGWKLPRHYPSTSYMAAVHWIARTIEQKPGWAEKFARQARACGFETGGTGIEPGTGIKCIIKAAGKQPRSAGLARLNGNCFFDSTLENDRLWKVNTADCRKKLRGLLKEHKEPAPFYALLLMDGDELGALLREDREKGGDGSHVSRALLNFSKLVKETVQAHNGITVYAGGDDVLALLPLEDALAAAMELQFRYKAAFKEMGREKRATISGAIIYAHHHAPLKSVLARLHHLLDKVAKDETGRDSLAVCVWKGAGPVLTWSAPWQVLLEGYGQDGDTVPGGTGSNLIDELVEVFAAGNDKSGEYNSSFFYNIRSRFEILAAGAEQEKNRVFTRSIAGGEDALLKENEDIVDLLTAEYLKGMEREKDRVSLDTANERMRRLVRLCRRSWREKGELHIAKGPLTMDGALLVRFLATKGVRE
ncbi:type III-B CRISPR-associated protein Cas10/Cmr2 [Desulfallas thermosapovorans]|uniref:CRISPR-associated Cmr2 family protein n=1 Tax=Desulfallas thermosapovorans DSM 6562 TaxID=1121431 RepID=A0A5S4ZN83_9FIRM|nr:type III-B CRISPR-associated protein Cas10/Cmr2 [Desulfallas thermosapovorans]TYO92768.1 CRISPR-associated Cmr2 family protein [Desulfallas thermosapovorans DSM 6562]